MNEINFSKNLRTFRKLKRKTFFLMNSQSNCGTSTSFITYTLTLYHSFLINFKKSSIEMK